MADSFDRFENEGNGNGFMMGLLTGTVLGAGIGMLLAPKAGSELRGAIGQQARHLGDVASQQYRRATESASGWAERGREMVDKAKESMTGTTGTTGATGSTGSAYGSGTSYGGATGTTGGEFGRPAGSDFGRS